MNFVIHHHVTVHEHYDFMLERGDVLETWRIDLADFNDMINKKTVRAEKIQYHRREYLTFQGPVSCDRGHVSIFDTGSYSTLEWSGEKIEIFLQGSIIIGKITITRPLTNEALFRYND